MLITFYIKILAEEHPIISNDVLEGDAKDTENRRVEFLADYPKAVNWECTPK
jgi:hypothetical protein